MLTQHHDFYRGKNFHKSVLSVLIVSSLTLPAVAQVPADADAVSAAPIAIVTAPQLRQHPLGVDSLSNTPSTSPALSPIRDDDSRLPQVAKPSSVITLEQFPDVLPAELHPWPLRYSAPSSMMFLFLEIPAEAEARLMLPGRAADAADRARAAVSKYISDTIGIAAQTRSRQADVFESWLATTDKQSRALTPDPWQAYEFTLESRIQVEQFRDQLARQSQPGLARMVADIQAAVGRITLIVNLMPTYELRMAWYNIMVQLKEGAVLYQNQVSTADATLAQLIEAYLQAHPSVIRPSGTPPKIKTFTASGATDKPAAPSAVTIAPPATIPSVALPKPEAPTQVGGFIVAGGILMGVAGILLRLRKRNGFRKEISKTEPTLPR